MAILPIPGKLSSGVNLARASEAQFIGGVAGNPCEMRGKTPLYSFEEESCKILSTIIAMPLKTSILSLFGNALFLSENGRTDEMKIRASETLAEYRKLYPTIDVEYKTTTEAAIKLRDEFMSQQGGENKEG